MVKTAGKNSKKQKGGNVMPHVVFLTKITWDAEEMKFRGEVAVCLPTTEDGEVIPLLRSGEVFIGDYPIIGRWGKIYVMDGMTYRYSVEYFTDKNLLNVERKMKQFIKEMSAILKKVYQANLNKEKQISPKVTKIVVYLDE